MKPSRKAEILADSDVIESAELQSEAEPVAASPSTPIPTPLELVKSALDGFGVPDLKTVIECCEGRIHELQREEVETLEEQMRAIQDKLIALRGPAQSNGRNIKPLRNPANPNEYYTSGMTPQWVRDLVNATGKPIWQLREESL